MMIIMTNHLLACDGYIQERAGRYETRAVRYRRAIEAARNLGLCDEDILADIGAGYTELDYALRAEAHWRGRYVPIEGAFDGVDLNTWEPPRDFDFFVALEILEHLDDPFALVERMKKHTRKGIIVSVPNPRVVDVLAMDDTHTIAIDADMLLRSGFSVTEATFYGGHYSNGTPNDALFAVWTPEAGEKR